MTEDKVPYVAAGKSIEEIGTEIEAVSTEAGSVSVVAAVGNSTIVPSSDANQHIIDIAARIDELVAAHNKIRVAILKLAMPGDWVVFGSEGEDKTPIAELSFAGALRIAATVGISYTNWGGLKYTGKDKIGDWYRYEFECDATFKGRTERVYGRAGSRDKFFGKAHGTYKDLSEVSEGDIKMAARRAAMKEGVKVLLGLHHIPIGILEQLGVDTVAAGGHTFQRDPSKTITPKQQNLLFIRSKAKGWTEAQLKEYIVKLYCKEHTKDLTMGELDEILKALEAIKDVPKK